jgi:micrococcal nuclease
MQAGEMITVVSMKRLPILLGTAIVLIALLFASALQAQDSTIRPREPATIIRVLDGDTIRVIYCDKRETVKLIGIEVPENKLNRKAKEEAIKSGQNLLTVISTGIDAAVFVKGLIKKGDAVSLEFDLQTRDIDGALLAYVYLPDGRMLNEEILKAGYADIEPNSPNMRYRQRLIKDYTDAKEHKRGFWK